jgi:hypothetical protein
LEEINVFNTDESWKEIFIDRNKQKDIDVFKLLQITNFGFYLKTNETVMISQNDPKDYRTVLVNLKNNLEYLIKPISLTAKMKQNNTQKELCIYNEDNFNSLARVQLWINLKNFDLNFEKSQFDVIIQIVNHVSKYERFQHFHHESRKFYLYRPECTVKENPREWFTYAACMARKRMRYLRGKQDEFTINPILLNHYKILFHKYFAKYINDPIAYEEGKADYIEKFNKILTILDTSLLYEWALVNIQEYFQNNRKEKNKKAKVGLFGGFFSKKINEEDLLTPEEEEKILEIIEATKREVKAISDNKEIKIKVDFSLDQGSFTFTKHKNNLKEDFGFNYKDLNFILMNTDMFTQIEAFLKDFKVEMATEYGKGNRKAHEITFRDDNIQEEFVWKLNFRHNSPDSPINSRLDLQIVKYI